MTSPIPPPGGLGPLLPVAVAAARDPEQSRRSWAVRIVRKRYAPRAVQLYTQRVPISLAVDRAEPRAGRPQTDRAWHRAGPAVPLATVAAAGPGVLLAHDPLSGWRVRDRGSVARVLAAVPRVGGARVVYALDLGELFASLPTPAPPADAS